METNLHFVITKVDGTTVEQDMKCPADAVDAAINQMMAQYSQVGMLKKEGNRFTLLPRNQIALVEVELSSLVVASPSDTARVASASGALKKILT